MTRREDRETEGEKKNCTFLWCIYRNWQTLESIIRLSFSCSSDPWAWWKGGIFMSITSKAQHWRLVTGIMCLMTMCQNQN